MARLSERAPLFVNRLAFRRSFRRFYALSEVLTPIDICSRTQEVQEAIFAQPAVTSSDCAAVPIAELAVITALDLNAPLDLSPLQSGDFDHLSGLEELRIGGHGLTSLPGDIFAGLSSLTLLQMNGNNLAAGLPAEVFSGLESLNRLWLYNTLLPSLPVGIFDGLDALTELLLDENAFTAGAGLPRGVFDPVLDTLDAIATSGNAGFVADDNARAAHFVYSRADTDSIVAATTGVTDCLRITAAQLDAALPMVTDTSLSGLTLTDGTTTYKLAPAFDTTTLSYSVNLPNSVSSVMLTPTANNSAAAITVVGTAVNSGAASGETALTASTAMEIAIVVTTTDTITIADLYADRRPC